MFAPKNIIAYIATDLPSLDVLESALSEKAFKPRESQSLSGSGWVPPAPGAAVDDAGNDCFVVDCHGVFLVALKQESALLPGAVVTEFLNDKVALIESEQCRKVYRKERLQLKDEVLLDLLPRSFSRSSVMHALVCPALGRIFVDASSHAAAEILLNELRTALGSLKVALPKPVMSAGTTMTRWLECCDMPNGWVLEDETDLCNPAEEGSEIKAKGQDLTGEDILAHIESGHRVTRLAVEWQQQLRVILNDDLRLQRLRLCDEYRDQIEAETPEDQLAAIDAAVWRYAKEIHQLLTEWWSELGGLDEDLSAQGQG